MSARLERERRLANLAKTSKIVTFWIDVFWWEYCNLQIWEVLSLEAGAHLGDPTEIQEKTCLSMGTGSAFKE